MWENRKFVATRNPSRGGLVISAATPQIEGRIVEEISETCLELIAKDEDHPCSCICPLSADRYMVAMAMKVAGSIREPRPHEVIRGIVADREELSSFCNSYIATGRMKELFFPERPDPDMPERWEIKAAPSDIIPNPYEGMDWSQVIGMYRSVCAVHKTGSLIHLMAPKGHEEEVFARCCCMAEQANAKLFIMLNGECTMKNPNILIHDRPSYQDVQRYRRMSLEQFLLPDCCFGEDECGDHRPDPDRERAAELVAYAVSYMEDDGISDFELYEYLGNAQEKEPVLYRQFIRRLREVLYRYPVTGQEMDPYMKLLYIAYKKTPDKNAGSSPRMETAPYDFGEIFRFLEKKAHSKREFKRLLTAMLEIQFLTCTGGPDDQTVHGAARRVAGLQ